MSGVNGGSASRSIGGVRGYPAPSVLIDLTDDSDQDKKRNGNRSEKRHEESKETPRENSRETPKEKSSKSFIDLCSSSDDEPSAPVTSQAKAKSTKFAASSSAKSTEKLPVKTQKYKTGGTYSLSSGGESDDEFHKNLPESISKQNSGERRNDFINRRSHSSSKSTEARIAGNISSPRQDTSRTARKTVVSNRKFNSGPVGPVGPDLNQNNNTSTPSSTGSTTAASKGLTIATKPSVISNLSHVMGQPSSPKATAQPASDLSKMDSKIAKESSTERLPFSNAVAPLPSDISSLRNDPATSSVPTRLVPKRVSATIRQYSRSPEVKESPLSTRRSISRISDKQDQNDNDEFVSQNDLAAQKELESRKATGHLWGSRTRGATGSSESAAKRDKSPSSFITNELSEPNRKFVGRDMENGADIHKIRKGPYQKKGNHGGARRGPAWEKQKMERESAQNTDEEAVDDNIDDGDDDVRSIFQKRRTRGQTSSNVVSRPASTRSNSPSLRVHEGERRGRLASSIPRSRVKSPILDASSDMVSRESSAKEIKASLVRLGEIGMEDWGFSLERHLEKSQLRPLAASNISLHDDDENPFASFTALDETFGEAINLITRTSKKAKTSNYVCPLMMGDGGVERTPSYTHHINVTRNHITGDDDILRYVPLVVQNEEKAMNKFERELNTAYTERLDNPRVKERITQINRRVVVALKNIGFDNNCDMDTLVQYFLGHQSEKIPYPMREKQLVLKTLGGPLSGHSLKRMAMVAGVLAEYFKIDLETVILSQSQFKAYIERSTSELHKRSDEPSARLETTAQFTCLICQGAACTTHGEYDYQKINKGIPSEENSSEIGSPQQSYFNKSDYEYAWEKSIMHLPDVLRKYNGRDHTDEDWHPELWNTEKDIVEACSDECYSGWKDWTNYSWNEGEENELKDALIIKPSRPCVLVDILEKPCWQIYSKILELEDKAPMSRSKSHQPSERVEWYNPKAVPRNRGLKPGWQDSTMAHLPELRSQPGPCVHEGPCSREMKCYCALNNLLCEQFCGCSDRCERRFAGCSCHSTGLACASDTCICFQMNRECGDQCNTCGAITRIRPQSRHKNELFQYGCQNIALQRGVNKKLILGKSPIEGAGFGLFTAEPVKKGDFLSEYTGELISDNETERRGVEYNAKFMSFLFNLNKEWTIDAMRMGNKTRFINHAESEADGMNCAARILLVNGEHRIAFRATRDILIGEELLFDYGPKFAELYGLNKKGGKGKGKMPKTNKATLNRLGGNNGKGTVPGTVAAKRKGWQKGRPRKASKKAKVHEYDVAGPSNATYPGEEEAGNGDEMMMDTARNLNLNDNILQDSDAEDEVLRGQGSDIEMGDAEEDEDENENEDSDEDTPDFAVRRTARRAKIPLRYTR
ncbi:putative set domain-containing protein [Botrytis fragariae]|uniref:Putative set domain-containing protein n=1 Tax=Botrytis fragariae TaxID=1964551 RepID=A0A8H6AI25_9HELO|nr:putative set domain-containing protein [Botrytis fragariae]KAF5867879.1 putative set domain-containing protein [Botrytis fragariae]